MPIDKSWMQKSRVSLEYDNGVLEFLEFAFNNASQSDKLPCSCVVVTIVYYIIDKLCKVICKTMG